MVGVLFVDEARLTGRQQHQQHSRQHAEQVNGAPAELIDQHTAEGRSEGEAGGGTHVKNPQRPAARF